jgi:Zn-dependent membrane protease YugP
MFMFDPYHLLFVTLPALVLSALTQLWLTATYRRFSAVLNRAGLTGADVARIILDSNGLHHVRIEMSEGLLSDHYDPRARVVRLSPAVYRQPSLAAMAVAAHECGHALQQARGYAPLLVRNIAVPLAAFGSQFAYIALIIGVVIGAASGTVLNPISMLGLGLLAGIVLFQVVNLPVEFNASARAMRVLADLGIATPAEVPAMRSLLAAAAMTYVAGAAVALLELLYWAWRLGLLGGNRQE